MNIEEIKQFFESVKERFSTSSNIHNLFDEVEEYMNQLEDDKLELSRGYIELAENSDYNHDIFLQAQKYIKEVEK